MAAAEVGGLILDFSFGGRTEDDHEMALESVSGSDFANKRHEVPLFALVLTLSLSESGRNPARNANFRPGLHLVGLMGGF